MTSRLVIFLSLTVVFCSEAPKVSLVPTNRVVLGEFFTYQRCSYCPFAARALESLVTEFQDSVVIIAYHRRLHGDTLSPEYVEMRRAVYYESGGEPATVFDGGEVVRTSGPEYNYEIFRNYILKAKSVLPKAQIEVEGWIESGTGTAVVLISGVDSTPPDTLRLFLVVTEDSVRSLLPGATDSLYNNVMRAMIPDFSGWGFTLLPGDTVRFEEKFPIPNFWDKERLRIVAFVQERKTNRVLQTAKTNIKAPSRAKRSLNTKSETDSPSEIIPSPHTRWNRFARNDKKVKQEGALDE